MVPPAPCCVAGVEGGPRGWGGPDAALSSVAALGPSRASLPGSKPLPPCFPSLAAIPSARHSLWPPSLSPVGCEKTAPTFAPPPSNPGCRGALAKASSPGGAGFGVEAKEPQVPLTPQTHCPRCCRGLSGRGPRTEPGAAGGVVLMEHGEKLVAQSPGRQALPSRRQGPPPTSPTGLPGPFPC